MGRTRRKDPWFETRDNGIYYVYWYDDAKRQTCRESLATRDHNEALKGYARFLLAGPRSPNHVGDAGIKVSQILDWYDKGNPACEVEGHVETKVVDKVRQRDAFKNLKAYFNGENGKPNLVQDVDIAASHKYAKTRREGRVDNGSQRKSKAGSSSTVRRELGALIAAANFCVRHKLLPADQTPRVEMPAEDSRKAPWLTKAAVAAVFAHADGKLKVFCRLAYYWGARRASIETLQKCQIDLAHGRVDLHPPGGTRTPKRRPIVPIYPEIRSDIELLLDLSATKYLFGTPRDFYRDFVELCTPHGVKAVDAPDGKAPWPHLLRHSRATHMLMDGESVYKVARLLGDTVATVERVYGHHSAEFLATHSTVDEVA